jgi:hypothetical protein
MTSLPIVASDLKRIDKGSVLGTVSLHIPSWKLKFRSVLWGRTEDGREWVRLASREWTDGNGNKHYEKTVAWDDAAMDRRFQEAALAAIRRLVAELGQAP